MERMALDACPLFTTKIGRKLDRELGLLSQHFFRLSERKVCNLSSISPFYLGSILSAQEFYPAATNKFGTDSFCREMTPVSRGKEENLYWEKISFVFQFLHS